jgi:RHS repeat-associated protein
VSVNYSDGTTNRGFAYDTNIYWAQTGTNLKGRLAVTGGGTGPTWNGSSISYDAMGRVVAIWACGPANCGTGYQAGRPLSFAYDWVGNLTQESDNVSGTINYGRSIAGEVTSITNATYQNSPYNPPTLVSNVVNGPNGPVSYTLGNGLNVYRSYDGLGRWYGQWVCSGPATMYCSGGAQVYGTAAAWKGAQVQSQADTVLNQQIAYGYDGFNRLTARTVTSGTQQNYTYSYDRYGNRVSQTALQTGYNFNPTINPANNQITTSGYTYDAAGNMTNDTVHSYTYDGEGNITKVDGGSTAQYVYDVFNRRIHVQMASATTEYIYDYAGRRVSSWLSPNNTGNEGRIYWDGQQFAYRSSDGTTYFDHQDTLGTDRIRTNYGGWVASSYLSLPWGDGYSATVNNAGADQDNEHFAGLERDAESGTEHAQFRNYASAQGRWLAPDPHMGSYDLSNPQSMNRYAYVLNSPLSFVDPSGLEECLDDPCEGGGGGGGGFCDPFWGDCGGGGCDPLWGDCGGGGWPGDPGGGAGGGYGGGASGSSAGNGPPHLEPNWGKDPGSFGESLGFPTARPMGSWGVAAALGLPGGPGCEFGACGAGASTFTLGPGAIAGTIACQFAEPCGAIEDSILVIGAAAVAGIDIYNIYRGGKTGVGHDYVRDMARALGGDYCSALKSIRDAARKRGDSKLFNDAKATYKQDCRGYSD